jgi:hypothetical protein
MKKPVHVSAKAGETFVEIRAAVAAGDWEEAIRLASKIGKLGEAKAEILRAREAYERPDFLRQLRKDPEAAKEAGKEALRRFLALPRPASAS